VNTGPDGDPNLAMVLADIRPGSPVPPVKHEVNRDLRQPEYNQIDLQAFEASKPDFVVSFTEDQNGFYIKTKNIRRNPLR
jgi:hypothetical protein